MVEDRSTVVCPQCGYRHDDCHWEMVDYDKEDHWSEVWCDRCEEPFRCHVKITYMYQSKIIPEEEL